MRLHSVPLSLLAALLLVVPLAAQGPTPSPPSPCDLILDDFSSLSNWTVFDNANTSVATSSGVRPSWPLACCQSTTPMNPPLTPVTGTSIGVMNATCPPTAAQGGGNGFSTMLRTFTFPPDAQPESLTLRYAFYCAEPQQFWSTFDDFFNFTFSSGSTVYGAFSQDCYNQNGTSPYWITATVTIPPHASTITVNATGTALNGGGDWCVAEWGGCLALC